MGPRVDVDDLMDAAAIAELLGLSSRRTVSVYRNRYPDFPVPVLKSDEGRCLFWVRQDVERWAKATGRLT